MPQQSTIYTIGHSTRQIEEFRKLLRAHDIQLLIDVRTIPRSRHNPQFNAETLAASLADSGISYQHAANLGGLRKPKKDSINIGWRNESFRGYADYMQSVDFWQAIDELTVDRRQLRTAIMCAEAVPWRCHRSLIADALMSRGWEVRHLMSETKAGLHRLTSFATIEKGLIRYPDPDAAPRLF
jgi:uncharacterized protein (DUF488 family)